MTRHPAARARQATGRAQNGALAQWRAGVPTFGGGAHYGPRGARLDADEREKLLTWVPVIRDTIEKAEEEAKKLAAKVVGVGFRSQIAPIDPSNQNRSGGESAS
ncbi:hypothetical protein GCM10009804_61300 [Kribbella hippodromi]|uniref:Uncharacterized protein n=1 Tax=Kribbella hippodromi TaxID=434347 RepID=A0ABN2E4W2_9ACTN